MNKIDRLKEIDIENFVWFIYIGIIFLSWYANSKEKKFILYDDLKSRDQYREIMIFIFIVLCIIYYYFMKSGYEDYLELKCFNWDKRKTLRYASFIGSLLVFISGIIFLVIIFLDQDIDTEIAFN